MRRFGADIVTVTTGLAWVLGGCADPETPDAAQKFSVGHRAEGGAWLPQPTLPSFPDPGPNAGDVVASLTVALPSAPSQLLPVDLDQDARDEILLHFVDGWRVATLDARGEVLALEPVIGALDDTLAVVSEGAVLGIGDTPSLASLTRTESGWVVNAAPVAEPVQWAMVISDWNGDDQEDVAVVVDGKLQIRMGPLDPELGDGTRGAEITDWPGAEVPPLGCRVVQTVESGDPPRSVVFRAVREDGNAEIFYIWLSSTSAKERTLEELGTTEDYLGVPAGCEFDNDDYTLAAPEGVWEVDDWFFRVESPNPTLAQAWPGTVEYQQTNTVLATRGDEMSWWYPRLRVGRSRPDATAAMPGAVAAALGRFGSTERVDLAWADTDTLYVLPAFAGLVGTDVDRDGYTAPEDCDDTDALTVPGASDPWDGIDNDCDGVVDEADDGMLVRIVPDDPTWPIGKSVSVMPDPAGDRLAWIEGGVLNLKSFTVDESWDLVEVGDLSLIEPGGDLDGDGAEDLLLGADGGGGWYYSVTVAYGPAASIALSSVTGWANVSGGFAAGDIDEDGSNDLVSHGMDIYLTGRWAYYYNNMEVAFGAPDRTEKESFRPFGTTWEVFPSLFGPADVNGDGHMDLGRAHSGDLQVFPGPIGRDEDLRYWTDYLTIANLGDQVEAVAIDGGTPDDLMVFDDGADAVVLLEGPFPMVPLEYADLRGTSFTSFDSATADSVVIKDGWIYIGAPGKNESTGAVYAFPLDPLQDMDESQATYVWPGPAPGAEFGARVALGDLDADGADELVVGATGSLNDEYAGAIYVYRIPH